MAVTQELATGGIVSISVAPVGILSAETDWTELFYTLRDSIAFTQAEPTMASINVDQLALPVYVSFTASSVVLTGTIPDSAAEVLEYLYETTATDPYAPATHTATGIKIGAKPINTMAKIEFDSGHIVIITNGTLVSWTDGATLKTTALSQKFAITAKAGAGGLVGEAADFVIWHKTAV